jgi:hypothetical protein
VVAVVDPVNTEDTFIVVEPIAVIVVPEVIPAILAVTG